MRISVIGLGKLGAPLAAVLASRGHHVVGTDINREYVSALNTGRAPVSEPGLQDLIERSRDRISATTDVAEAVSSSDATFVIVPTPSGPDGAFSNAQLISAMHSIGSAVRAKIGYHLVVVTSTVMPGSTDGPIRHALEQSAGRAAMARVGLCYSPEFIALGSVIHDMLNPDFVLIGESDHRAGDMLEGIYRSMCDNRPVVQRMNFVNAELTKIAVNTYVTTKISFANMISDLCDRLPGADASTVTTALGCDTRIGGKYLRPGLGYGGPCFPRDNAALAAIARQMDASAELAEATDRINRQQPARVVDLVRRLLAHGTVGILGLSYKPNTAVVEESQAVDIAQHLARSGYRVIVYDPQAIEAAKSELGDQIESAADVASCATAADLLIIATPWPSFRDLPLQALRRPNGHRLPVIDCWRLLPRAEVATIVDLIYPGEAPAMLDGEPEPMLVRTQFASA